VRYYPDIGPEVQKRKPYESIENPWYRISSSGNNWRSAFWFFKPQSRSDLYHPRTVTRGDISVGITGSGSLALSNSKM